MVIWFYNRSSTAAFTLWVVLGWGCGSRTLVCLRAAELRTERMGMESYTLCDFRGQLKSDDGDLDVERVTQRVQH